MVGSDDLEELDEDTDLDDLDEDELENLIEKTRMNLRRLEIALKEKREC